MTTEQYEQLLYVMKSVREWPQEMRVVLATRLLQQMETDESFRNRPRTAMTIDEFHAKYPRTTPAPTDEEVEQMKEDYLMEKHGR